jgi:hypothetical protein
MITIQGDTIDKKISFIETILNRFSRRLNKTIIFMSPSSVISGFSKEIPEDGIVLHCVFPCGGKIKGITTSYDAVKDSKLITKVTVGNTEYTNPTTDIVVNLGDKMIVKVEGVGSNIYFSVLFTSNPTTAEKETLAIDVLDKVEE